MQILMDTLGSGILIIMAIKGRVGEYWDDWRSLQTLMLFLWLIVVQFTFITRNIFSSNYIMLLKTHQSRFIKVILIILGQFIIKIRRIIAVYFIYSVLPKLSGMTFTFRGIIIKNFQIFKHLFPGLTYLIEMVRICWCMILKHVMRIGDLVPSASSPRL